MARAIDADVLANKIMEIWDRAENEGRTDIANFIANIIVPCIVGTPTIEPKQEWISVKDRLPKRKREYLCLCQFGDDPGWRYHNVLLFHPEKNADNGIVKGPHFSNEGMDDMKVAYWMPLPEPPEKNN